MITRQQYAVEIPLAWVEIADVVAKCYLRFGA
jgi:hypothetical protein